MKNLAIYVLALFLLLGSAIVFIFAQPLDGANADEGEITIRVKLEGTRDTAEMQTIPVTVKFWTPDTVIAEGAFPSGGSVLYTVTGTTTNWNSGSKTTDFIVAGGSVPDGNYVLEIKEDTSLSNLKGPITVNAGDVVYMGELQEGDTTGDGRLLVPDLNLYKSNHPCFDGCSASCDFNGDGLVNVPDANILKTDYPKFGPHLWYWK